MKDDDFKLLRGFDNGRTNEQTFVIVESLLRLKIKILTMLKNVVIQPFWQTIIYDTNSDIYHQMSKSLLGLIQEKICQGPDKYVDQRCSHTGWGEAWSLGL